MHAVQVAFTVNTTDAIAPSEKGCTRRLGCRIHLGALLDAFVGLLTSYNIIDMLMSCEGWCRLCDNSLHGTDKARSLKAIHFVHQYVGSLHLEGSNVGISHQLRILHQGL